MALRELFASDVTRDIPPVVYFHEQSPDHVAAEVSEYIITGGWPDGHPHKRRVPDGIHEQYVHLLTGIAQHLTPPPNARPGWQPRVPLPASWISGFYGSGKSSFAKLLGLALDDLALPDGRPLSEALLARDTSQNARQLRDAWRALTDVVDPLAVVFDIGGAARDGEPIHAAILRKVQARLGYSTDAWVARYELKLEREGHWPDFLAAFQREHGAPWDEVKADEFAEDEFSAGLHRWRPDLYAEPHAWVDSRAGAAAPQPSPQEAATAIGDALARRAPGKTLFIVVDEVSQYIHQDHERMLALQSFVSELGQRLHGRAWLLVTGQQKLDEAGQSHVLGKMKDRFPPRLRVHLAPTNIRDVVHRRLLDKSPAGEARLRALLEAHRHDLRLFAYGCEDATVDELVEVYPLLPGQVDLLLRITSALRLSSTRAQGDDQNIRGLLQLLGELFRERRLADRDLGALVTIDDVYEVQATALSSDAQNAMRKVYDRCGALPDPELALSCAKAVALLQLVQEDTPTTAELVAKALYDRVDRGDRAAAVEAALEALRDAQLLGLSEQHGYKLQSAAGEEWERERQGLTVSVDDKSERVQAALEHLVSLPDMPAYKGRRFPWAARFSDHRPLDKVLKRASDPAHIAVDLRWVRAPERGPDTWIPLSDQAHHRDSLIWVTGDTTTADDRARDLVRSLAMIRRYEPRRASLPRELQVLLLQEQARAEDLDRALRQAVEAAMLAGALYFRGRPLPLDELGAAMSTALFAAGEAALPELFPDLVSTQVTDRELEALLAPDITAPSTKLLEGELGVLTLDGGQYVARCQGVAPQSLLTYIRAYDGTAGDALLRHFTGPPTGYSASAIRACALGLLRGRFLKVVDDAKRDLTAVRDAGVREVFLKDRDFRRASFYLPDDDPVDARTRVKIARFFEEQLDADRVGRDDVAIAEAVEQHLHGLNARLTSVEARLNRLRPSPETPEELKKLKRAIEDCVRRTRQTQATVREVARHLTALVDGVKKLNNYDAELTDEVIAAVVAAHDAWEHRFRQLAALGPLDARAEAAGAALEAQLTGPRPWSGVTSVDADVAALTELYRRARQRLLDAQLRLSQDARERLKADAEWHTLDADQSNHVLRPLSEALTDTTAEALRPPLVDLDGAFRLALQRAEAEARERLDAVLDERVERRTAKVRVRLQHKVIRDQADLDAVLAELRERVSDQLAKGRRVRLHIEG